MDPITILTVGSTVLNAILAYKNRNKKKALHALVDGIEIAAKTSTDPKRAVVSAAGASVARDVIDKVLDKKGYRKRAARSQIAKPNRERPPL